LFTYQFSLPLSINNRIALVLSNFLKELRSESGVTQQTQVILKNLVQDKQLHILIADDDEDDKELFDEAISEISPYILISMVANGRELMQHLADHKLPDIVFLDLNMPAMNGFECLEAIKKSDALKDLPVIIYSTSANWDQINKTYLNGASLYIQKPSNYQDIKKLLTKILEVDIEKFFIQPGKSEFLIKM